MFVLLFVRTLAQYPRRWVVVASGLALTAAGIAVMVAGILAAQPLVAHVGLMILVVAIALAAFAWSARRHHADRFDPRREGHENGEGGQAGE
jgi:uncharacterized membrane protein HdeD (DUF308 family)